MKFNAYKIISDAVESGIESGLHYAYKHTDTPTREAIAISIEQQIINALCEVIDFEQGEY